MNLENNWRQQTLEKLENEYWGIETYDSHLVKRCQELRKLPLGKFETEDLRIMIGQQIGLDYLIPLAIEVLTIDLFAEGDFFEEDLLKNVLAIETEFWNNNKNHWIALYNLIKDHRSEIVAHNFDSTKFDKSIHLH
jgi:hypothetical protein